MSDFLFHKVDEKEKEEIRKEASEIIDSFSKKLESIKDLPKESVVEKEECYREEDCKEKRESGESSEEKREQEFKKKLLDNAPRKNKDFILSEKKKW